MVDATHHDVIPLAAGVPVVWLRKMPWGGTHPTPATVVHQRGHSVRVNVNGNLHTVQTSSLMVPK